MTARTTYELSAALELIIALVLVASARPRLALLAAVCCCCSLILAYLSPPHENP
jgi:hypothetical protein